MAETPMETLVRYLQTLRDAVLWKLDGLSEYDARRPLTPTGTNVLGVVKHLAYVEAGYFGDTFGRPFPEPLPAFADDAEYNADLWVAAGRVARVHRGALPEGVGARCRDVRGGHPGDGGQGAVVAGGAGRGDAAPDPGAHDHRDRTARRPRRHRARADRRLRRDAARGDPTCPRRTTTGRPTSAKIEAAARAAAEA